MLQQSACCYGRRLSSTTAAAAAAAGRRDCRVLFLRSRRLLLLLVSASASVFPCVVVERLPLLLLPLQGLTCCCYCDNVQALPVDFTTDATSLLLLLFFAAAVRSKRRLSRKLQRQSSLPASRLLRRTDNSARETISRYRGNQGVSETAVSVVCGVLLEAAAAVTAALCQCCWHAVAAFQEYA